jgi:hypothetical protein
MDSFAALSGPASKYELKDTKQTKKQGYANAEEISNEGHAL